ncbi:hypothetical protein GCM10029964_087090 [Kibdelosporangium lantanae]
MTALDRPAAAVAVVGDSAVADEPDLGRYRALIQDMADVPARVMPLDGADVRTALRDLPADVGAVFLPHAPPDHSPGDNGLPLLTGRDSTAIALSAAVLTTLTRAGHPPRTSRVLIAGANTVPLLSPLLMVAGVGDITTWSMKDAVRFPLRRLIAGVHVVVDLLGIAAQAGTDTPNTTPAVVTPHGHDASLAVPGLLRALLRTSDARLDVAVCHACVLALVMATPPGGRLPPGPDRALTDRVAEAAAHEMRHPTRHPFDFGSGRPAC